MQIVILIPIWENACTVFELDFYSHKISEYIGGYSDYVVQKAKKIEKEIEAFNREQKKKKEMEEWIALKTQQLSFYQSPKVARQLQSYKKRYERETSSMTEKSAQSKKIKINEISETVDGSKLIFRVESLKCRNLIYCKSLDCFGGDRIHLEGKNGSGKTTFLKILLKQINDYTGNVVFGNNLYKCITPQLLLTIGQNNLKTIIDTQNGRFIDGENIFEVQQYFDIVT